MSWHPSPDAPQSLALEGALACFPSSIIPLDIA